MEKKEIKIDKLHVHVWKGEKIIKEIDAIQVGIYTEVPPQEGDCVQFGFEFEGKWFEIRAAVK